MLLKNKNVVLCVSGGIAVYKALELVRLLKKEGANVYPVMSRAAVEFVTPLSFTTLSEKITLTDMFAPITDATIDHIDVSAKADIVIIAPATANTIGKVAGGIADNFLTTIVMATTAPVLIAPAMNNNMYDNPIVKENICKLKAHGYIFVGPDEGELACGTLGRGRMSSVMDIMESVREVLSRKDLSGEKVLVTAAATREPIDPVRFVSNASSGRMGYAIARAAKRRGAEVVLISGPSSLDVPMGATFESVETMREMQEAVIKYYPQSTVVIMAAAISDFRPVDYKAKKIKKADNLLKIELERTEDILKGLGSSKDEGKVLVGFALETDDMIANATKKLEDKNLDMVVANGPLGLNSEVNQVTLIEKSGNATELPPLVKDEVAERILDCVVRLKGG